MLKNEQLEVRKSLSEFIEKYRKIKSGLDFSQRNYVEGRIKAVLKDPKSEFHYDENGEIQLGKIIWNNCRYCNKDLTEMRNTEFPKLAKNAERFCSKICMIQFSKHKKMQDFGPDLIIWGERFR